MNQPNFSQSFFKLCRKKGESENGYRIRKVLKLKKVEEVEIVKKLKKLEKLSLRSKLTTIVLRKDLR